MESIESPGSWLFQNKHLVGSMPYMLSSLYVGMPIKIVTEREDAYYKVLSWSHIFTDDPDKQHGLHVNVERL